MIELKQIDQLQVADIEKLVEESEAEGYRFLRRLVNEYESGKIRSMLLEKCYTVYGMKLDDWLL